ncbi:MAG: YdeI/OmpD-associated family protein [Myxococcales bacterium]|nr:YdeI/OmpD-associated family protein [Myxococcales bacterium]
MASDVDRYFRTSKGWQEESKELRSILNKCDLTEELKWGKPCYGADGNNIAIVQKMKGFLALMFFKGALLQDPKALLKEQGPNSRSAKRLEFTSVSEIKRNEANIKHLVREALRVEKAGLKVTKPEKLELIPELRSLLKKDRALNEAFYALTPGRQREYNLHFGGAKQTETRQRRIDACTAKILAGKGFRDR